MKKILKKSLACAVSAALCMTAIVGCLTARADTVTPAVTVVSATAEPGESISVPVQFTGLNDVAGLQATITVDTLTLTAASSNVFNTTNDNISVVGNTVKIADTLNGFVANVEAITGDTLNLSITVPANTEVGTYNITLSDVMFCDYEENELAGTITSGTVTVTAPHVHDFTDNWVTDETNHWKVCETDAVIGQLAAHTFGAPVVVEPTASQDGSSTVTCTICGYEVVTTLPAIVDVHVHTWGDLVYSVEGNICYTKHACTGCDEVETVAAITNVAQTQTVSLGASLAITFRIQKNAVESYNSIFASITKDLYSGNTLTGVSEPTVVVAATNSNRWQFKYEGIGSSEMTSQTHTKIFGTDGSGNVVLLSSSDYAFVDYLESKQGTFVATFGAKLGAAYNQMVADTARYGAAAQTYGNYHTDYLATDNIDSAYMSDLPTTFGDTSLYQTGTGLGGDSKDMSVATVLGNSIVFRLRVKQSAVSGYEKANLKMTVDYTDAHGDPQVFVANGSDFVSTKVSSIDRWQVEFSELAASSINDNFVVRIYDGETELGSYNYSFAGYAATSYSNYSSNPSQASFVALCQSVVAFGNSAAALA